MELFWTYATISVIEASEWLQSENFLPIPKKNSIYYASKAK